MKDYGEIFKLKLYNKIESIFTSEIDSPLKFKNSGGLWFDLWFYLKRVNVNELNQLDDELKSVINEKN